MCFKALKSGRQPEQIRFELVSTSWQIAPMIYEKNEAYKQRQMQINLNWGTKLGTLTTFSLELRSHYTPPLIRISKFWVEADNS